MALSDPPKPHHVKGTPRGEERVQHKGREPGRDEHNPQGYRSARDATSIDPQAHEPIDPLMPSIPPA
jgi:hypothetical protein